MWCLPELLPPHGVDPRLASLSIERIELRGRETLHGRLDRVDTLAVVSEIWLEGRQPEHLQRLGSVQGAVYVIVLSRRLCLV